MKNFSYYCSASCGLFMLKYMEYWTGDMLSDEITQVFHARWWKIEKKNTVKKTRHPFLTNFRGREGLNPGGWRERTLSWPPVPGDPHTMMKICILYSGEINDITTMQDDMTKFRPKLGAILLSSKLNKKGRSLVQPINEAKECSDDFVMLSSPKQVSAQTVMKMKTMISDHNFLSMWCTW